MIRKLSLMSRALLVCVALCAPLPALASFSIVVARGVVATLATGSSTLTSPSGVVSDFSGNVYVSDAGAGQIIKIAPDGVTAAVLSISGLSPALISPRGIALDSAGNLYIADSGNSRVVKVSPAGSGSVVSTPTITLSAPQGVAVDITGNVFISDTGNSRIIEVNAGGTASVFGMTGLGTALNAQRGIAIDPRGNLFIADSGNNRVVKVTSTGAATVVNVGGFILNLPSGVAVGNNGMLYIADTNQDRVVIVDSQGNASLLLNGSPAFDSPLAVAANSMGAVYVVDSICSSGTGRVQLFESLATPSMGKFTTAVNLGRVQLGGAGASVSVPFSVGPGTTLTAVTAYTSGAPSLDFTVVNDSTCAVSTTNTNCAVHVKFAPTAVGLRNGALVLAYNAGGGGTGTLTVPIFGVADAPVATVSPGVASVFNIGTTALASPFQAAVDGAGKIYVSSYTGNKVVAFPAGGGSGTPVDTGGLILSGPTGVALDGTGNLFIADHHNNRIVKVATDGTASVFAISGLGTSISLPTALAFDGAGNLYITDYGVGRMVEVNPAGQGTVLATANFTFATSNITGTAVDAFGNVYIVDPVNNRILKVDPLGNTTIISVSTAGTLSDPQGVAVDGSGNLYIVDSGHQRILQVTTAGVASIMKFAGVTLGSSIYGSTVDPSGNLLISDWSNNRLVKVNVGQSTLAFASTQVGATSSDSPKTLTVTNNGDMPLIFPIPAAGNNPAVPPGFVLQNSSTCPQLTQSSSSAGTLPAGNQCTLSLSFIPTAAGPISSSLVITNNSLNAVGPGYASQTATLSGVATQSQSAVTWSTPDAITYGTALGPTQLNASSGAVAGTFAYSPAAGTILTAGTHTLSVTFTPTDTNGHVPATATTTITVNQAASSVAFSSSGTGQPGSPLTLTATVTATYGTPTGTVQFLAGATVLGSAPLDATGVATFSTSTLPAGGGTLTAQYSGDADYSASMADTSVAASFSIATTAPALSVQLPGSGSVPLTFNPMGGFAGTVTLSCSGLPPSLACNFNPQVFVADGSDQAQTSELTISTRQSGAIVGLLLLPGMAIGGVFSRRRREPGRKARRAVIVAGVIAVLSAAVGCSSGHVQNTQTYNVAVTAVVSQANGYKGPPTQIAMLAVTLTN